MPPTLLADVAPDDRVVQEEIFSRGASRAPWRAASARRCPSSPDERTVTAEPFSLHSRLRAMNLTGHRNVIRKDGQLSVAKGTLELS